MIIKNVYIADEYLKLTGDLVQASVLQYFMNLYKDENNNKNDGWIGKTINEINKEVEYETSISEIKSALDVLVEKEWMFKRDNDEANSGNMYKVNIDKLVFDLFDYGYIMKDYKYSPEEIEKMKKEEKK